MKTDKPCPLIINPTANSDMLHIDVDLLNFEVKIVNIQGQIVRKEKNTSDIDVSLLSNSIYFLQVFEKDVLRGVRKFVINR